MTVTAEEYAFLLGYRTRMIMHALTRVGRKSFATVLDIGCADGAILRLVAEKIGARTAVGVDLNAPDGGNGGLILRRCNFLDFTPEKPFELVISNQVFEHVYEPWLLRYFAVLKACCGPKGVILLSTPNRWRALNLMRLLTFRAPHMEQKNPGVPPVEHLGHHRECSYSALRDLLRSNFPPGSWQMTIVRSVPRNQGSRLRWLARLVTYAALWPVWRPLFVSASQDHYVVLERTDADSAIERDAGQTLLAPGGVR